MAGGEARGGGLRGRTFESKCRQTNARSASIVVLLAKPVYATISVVRSSGHRG